jgi:hypothetical protein
MTTERSTPPGPSGAVATPSGRGALLGLAALFFVPLLGAFWLYYIGGWRPAGSTNHGELIAPARPLAAAPLLQADGAPAQAGLLRGKWTLLYIDDGACATSECREALWTLRQTRLLLAEDMDRVQRVFVAETGCCDREFLAREHAGLIVLTTSAPAPDAARTWIDGFPRSPGQPHVFIIDPLGNLMMRFDLRQNPKGLKSDLEKLLKLSHIG